MKSTYHYEYACYTDNLCWGKKLIGRYPSKQQAHLAGQSANKGCFVVEKERVYNN